MWRAAKQGRAKIMRVGVFGGSFDPVHYGHLLLAECCREQCRLEEVWFAPAAVPPHKQELVLSSAENRVEMLELAIASHPAFSVCLYEVEHGGVNYTVDTLAHLKEQDPKRELFFLLGADMLHDLPHWREVGRVCQLALPVVARRPGAEGPDFGPLREFVPAGRIEEIRRQQVEMPEIGISSTEIRRRVAAGQSIRYRVPRAVEAYIETHGLYGA